jgi:glycerate kinase
VFGPQKGASAAQVSHLTVRLRNVALDYSRRLGRGVQHLPGSAAAGALAGGLAALGATLVPGFGTVAEPFGFASRLAEVDLVITGEGRQDRSSFDGRGRRIGGRACGGSVHTRGGVRGRTSR